jgi:hypothetical protein
MSPAHDPVTEGPGVDPDDPHAGIRHRIEAFLERNKMVGLATPFEHVIEMFLGWWKHVGLRTAGLLMVLVLLPTAKYVVGPRVASSAVEAWAATLGLDLEVDDWSLSLHDLRVTAHGVRVKAHGRYASPNLFESASVAIDASLVRRLGGRGWIQDVEVEAPVVHLERTIAGRWNWGELRESREQLGERVGGAGAGDPDTLTFRVADTKAEATPADFALPLVRAHRLRLQWIQNMPAHSGSGVVQTLQGTVYVEDVELTLEDVAGFVDGRQLPSRISFEGRTADGKISVDGRANLFRWSDAAARPASTGATLEPRWTPTLEVTVYLEHVGAAAIGRMVPTAALVPTAGTLSGHLRLALHQDRLACQTTLTAQDLTYAPNLESPVVRPRAAQITEQLIGYRTSGPVLIGCEGNLRDSSYAPLEVIQTSITQEVTKTGPSVVRAVSTMDRRRASGGLANATTEAIASELTEQSRKISTDALGASAGAVVGAALEGGDTQGSVSPAQGNAVSRGLKGFGSGVKRLFGGGKKKP